MAHYVEMGDSEILRLGFIGDVGRKDVEAFMVDLQTYLDTASTESPLFGLNDAGQNGKFSAHARQAFTEINQDPRIARLAIYNASRFERVLVAFIIKVTKRNTVQVFDSKAEAMKWLENERKTLFSKFHADSSGGNVYE